jgi:hypothetical protein
VFVEGPHTAPEVLRLIAAGELRQIRVKVGVAHINQTAGDDRDENLAAWCDWCHLAHDRPEHLIHARVTRINRKDSSRPLLATDFW